MYSDIVIIGAGVVGCGLARELSRYNASVRVLEAGYDVAESSSRANSGIVHAGYDCVPGTNKAKFNVEGAKMYPKLVEELGVPYKHWGAMIIGFDESDKKTLEILLQQGIENGVEQLEIIDGKKALELEPNLNPEVTWALHVPTSAIVSPYEMNYALADNAVENGVDIVLETKVSSLYNDGELWQIRTDNGDYSAKCVINCAGLFSANIHNQISDVKYKIIPRKGEYFMLDRMHPLPFKHTIFQTPGKMGKGVLVSPTVHGNTFLGPSSNDVEDFYDTSTDPEVLDFVYEKSKRTWPGANKRNVVTTFSGLRAHEENGDFVIGRVSGAKNAYEALGIESPGLSAMPAIAKYLSEMLAEDMNLSQKKDWIKPTKRRKYFIDMTEEERQAVIAENNDYAQMVCRCEQVTEAEIREAIRRPMGARTVDGIKRRIRAGAGRCQGGFCSPRVIQILAEELHISQLDVCKFSEKSKFFVGKVSDFAIKEDSHE